MRASHALIGLMLYVCGSPASAADPIDAKAACRIMHARSEHVGKTITFVGKYLTDHIERSAVVPKGCDRGVGLGGMAPEAERLLAAADDPLKPDRTIDATFTGTLVRGEPNGATFANDDGIRLDVSEIAGVKVIDPPSR